MKKYLILFFLIIFVVILLIGWMGWKGYQLQKRDLSIVTDKTEYESGGILKVKIKNNFGENICFSSCYPYLLENKNENWESYKYAECQKFNGNGSCIEARKEKAFELTLPEAPEGLHRLAIPVCIGCQNEDTFKEDARFYSNEFTIKEKKVETANWKTYRNEEYGFEIKYPPDKSSLEVVNKYRGYFDFTTFEVITIGTSLDQKTSLPTGSPTGRITIYADRDPIWLEGCLKSEPTSKTTPDEIRVINGIKFSVFDESSAAMGGQQADEKSYRAIYNNTCYRIQSLVLWRSISSYHSVTDLKPVTEEEMQEESKLIQKINFQYYDK